MRRVAFVALLIVLAACHNPREKYQSIIATGGGNADHGKLLLTTYGCTSCHDIPGVEGPKGIVGPPLGKIAARQSIDGKFENTPQNMIQWIQNPQRMDPQNAMPNMGVTAADARDITAYLYTLN
jgi:cytochrome c1